MEFFTKENFKYYTNVIGKRYNGNSSQLQEVKGHLTKGGIFDKTAYWSDLLKDKGYWVHFRYDWQHSGRIRYYSWAKVFLPEEPKDSHIFFTVGVGSRSNRECDLIYKIDCLRKNGLSKYQIELFDQYIEENQLNRSNTIDANRLEDYTWDSLLTETEDFINGYKVHYKKLIEIIWPLGIGISSKIARVCWNIYDWQKPSGSEGKITNSTYSFESDKNYGFEEWLFDLDRTIDGYHYGFLQALNKKIHIDGIYDIHLYSIKKDKIKDQYYWIGRIKQCVIVDAVESQKILEEYKKRGWYNEMRDELAKVNVQDFTLDPLNDGRFFNLKFKVSEDCFIYFDEPIPISDPIVEIGKNRHYVLLDLPKATKSNLNSNEKYSFRSGNTISVENTSNISYTLTVLNKKNIHKKIQSEIFKYLATKYDENNVGTEVATGFGTSIDLVVRLNGENDIFYEVKVNSSARKAIREALGQLLEYSLYIDKMISSKMIVIGVHKPTEKELKYLNFLRTKTGLPLFYQFFSLELNELDNQYY